MTRAEAITFLKTWYPIHPAKQEARDMAVEALKQPKLVQCKDCIHWDDHLEECSNSDSVCFRNGMTGADWFCADGERKEG